MNFESICSLMDKFDASESVYLELEMEEVSIKLKKSEACKTACAPAQIPAMPFSPAMPGMMQADMGLANANKGTQESDSNPSGQQGYAEEDLVKAPLVGVFYAAPSPDQPAFVQMGSRVEKGDTLCLIEAMKMMSEVVAPKAGVVKEIFVENGAMVEFDASLFAIQE